MARDTAIFYDIENLAAGYAREYVDDLSLREIVRRIREKLPDSQIAVQRAYANWSSHALSALRKELSELGIEPVQVFGFNFDGTKNASDLELVIDAVDLAITRPHISNYVIVSGDGGFASLAKKLHEYGKNVVGCARQEATSKVFKAVCDEFVFIPEVPPARPPAPRPPPPPKAVGTAPAPPPRPADPTVPEAFRRFVPLARAVPPKPCATQPELLEQSRRLFAELAAGGEWRDELSAGIFLAVVKEMLRFVIPGLQEPLTGYAKFREALQCMAAGTPLCLAEKVKGEFRLFARDRLPHGVAPQPDLPPLRVDSEEGYRSLLAGGNPSTLVPAASTLARIARAIPQVRPRDMKLAEFIARVREASGEPETAVKQTLFAASDCFRRVPGTSPADQLFTLEEHVTSAGHVLDVLRETCRRRLADLLPPLGIEVDDAILAALVPYAAESAGA